MGGGVNAMILVSFIEATARSGICPVGSISVGISVPLLLDQWTDRVAMLSNYLVAGLNRVCQMTR